MLELLKPMFDQSKDDKKGLMVFFNGQSIPGVVRKYDDNLVELYNQQFDRIYIRILQIDAVALQ